MLWKIRYFLKEEDVQYFGTRPVRDASDYRWLTLCTVYTLLVVTLLLSVYALLVALPLATLNLIIKSPPVIGLFLAIAGLGFGIVIGTVTHPCSGLVPRGHYYYIQLSNDYKGLHVYDHDPKNHKPTLRITVGGLLNLNRRPRFLHVFGYKTGCAWKVRFSDKEATLRREGSCLELENTHGERYHVSVRAALLIAERHKPDISYPGRLREQRDMLGSLCYAMLLPDTRGIERNLVREVINRFFRYTTDADVEEWEKRAPKMRRELLMRINAEREAPPQA